MVKNTYNSHGYFRTEYIIVEHNNYSAAFMFSAESWVCVLSIRIEIY